MTVSFLHQLGEIAVGREKKHRRGNRKGRRGSMGPSASGEWVCYPTFRPSSHTCRSLPRSSSAVE